MKKLIIGAIVLSTFSTSVFADSYCYDRAVFAVERMQKEVDNCNTNLPLNKFDDVISALMSRNPIGHSTRIIKSMKNLNQLMYNDVYKYELQNNKCLEQIFRNTSDLKSKVMDALIQC